MIIPSDSSVDPGNASGAGTSQKSRGMLAATIQCLVYHELSRTAQAQMVLKLYSMALLARDCRFSQMSRGPGEFLAIESVVCRVNEALNLFKERRLSAYLNCVR